MLAQVTLDGSNSDLLKFLISLSKTPVWSHSFFSSPESKAQVSFSDQNLSVVRRRCRCRRCRKLFTFSSSSQEPLGQFQPNLAQSILGWRGFKFVQMKGHTLSQGEIIAKILKLYWKLLKSSSSEPLGQFQPNLAQNMLGWWWFKFVQMKGHNLLQVDIISK